MSLAILVPVLRRPHRVAPLLESIAAATPRPYRVLFVCDPGDMGEQHAIRKAGLEPMMTKGGYAAKINAAVRATDEPLLFLAADDLEPAPGWLEAATAQLADGAQVVGVNDLIDRSRVGKATHFLMTREYAEQPCADGSPGPLCTLYDHSWVDDELEATARQRGVYAYAEDSHVRHLHPMAGGEDDDTYRKGRAKFRQDRRLFHRRGHLWT